MDVFKSSTFSSPDELCEWIGARSGAVLGKNGRGGSGTFVQAQDDERIGILTATHVVLPAIFSGSMTVAGYSQSQGLSVEPTHIRMAPRADATILYMPSDFETPHLGRSAWSSSGLPAIVPGDLLAAHGLPGAFKSGVSPEKGRIDSARFLSLGAKLIAKHPEFMHLENTTFDTSPPTPASLGGMSGGGVFNFDGALVGIVTAEGLEALKGHLFFTNRDRWTGLTLPYSSPLGDYMGQEAMLELYVRHGSWELEEPLKVTMSARFFWSLGSKYRPKGEIGNVVCMTVGDTFKTKRYRINIESTFGLPVEHTEEERLEAFRLEGTEIIKSMGCRIVSNGLRILSKSEVENKMRTVAYHLWEERGRPANEDWKDWFAARAAIFEQQSSKGV